MAEPRLTGEETRLVERYLGVCDFLGRWAQAIDGGNWHYLQDKAAQLREASDRFADEALRAYRGRKLRPDFVLAGVRWWGRHYRASRLLHPVSVKLTTTEAGSIMLSVAGAEGLVMNDARLAEIIEAAAAIAELTDVLPATVVRVLAALRSYEVRDDTR
jgi:hypothetical protein